MTTALERIADKARREPTLQFTSLAHHLTPERLWQALHHMQTSTAPGVDGVPHDEAVDTFPQWSREVLNALHRKGYHPPPVRRVWIPKPGKAAKRPLGVPTIVDRTLQRSVAEVLSAIYEQDFLPVSFGGRPGRGAHHALATLHHILVNKRGNWVLEADLKNVFGSLDHAWMMQFVEQRVGDPRVLSLIRRWLKVGVLEAGEIQPSLRGTPQGGSISVLLSNVYLHYVLDLWFQKAIKPRLEGEAYLVRYVDDVVVCFEHQRDAERFQAVLSQRLNTAWTGPGTHQNAAYCVWAASAPGGPATGPQETGDPLFLGVYALLHADPAWGLSGRAENREVASQADAPALAQCDAADSSRPRRGPIPPY